MVDLDIAARRSTDRDLQIDLIIENGHTRTPVKEHGAIIGYIHSDDLLPLMLRDTRKDLKSLVRSAPHVPHDRRVSDLLNDFSSSGIYCAFVVNAKNAVEGFVTLEDVLEEITGEILDEYDVEHQ
jgi:CBS domain containing-hemolysin-like protein